MVLNHILTKSLQFRQGQEFETKGFATEEGNKIPDVIVHYPDDRDIIIDSKSGYSGAGRAVHKKYANKNLYESLSAYGVGFHRHNSEIEQEMTKKIESLLLQISKDKLELETVLWQNMALKREKEGQMSSLRKIRIKREKELTRIRQDKNALANYIQEKSAGIKQLEGIIKKVLEDKARFEREERIRKQQEALKTKSFHALQGQLPWPAGGRIISKFGKQWNPKLKTTTENPGIDIKGKPGSAIRTIMSGVVTTITYIRGYGTTIIIDHGGGFYTVYSHVTNIQTHVDSETRSGDVIAYMGDSGSINGSKLHFEIWGKGKKLNPEKWLSKQQ
mgnify:CR=1 FL=1